MLFLFLPIFPEVTLRILEADVLQIPWTQNAISLSPSLISFKEISFTLSNQMHCKISYLPFIVFMDAYQVNAEAPVRNEAVVCQE